jgi:hypothetical protein
VIAPTITLDFIKQFICQRESAINFSQQVTPMIPKSGSEITNSQ